MGNENKIHDRASRQMLDRAERLGIETAWDRRKALGALCPFGTSGLCCQLCNLGPCRLTQKHPRGACGADMDTVVARNMVRKIAAGAAAHGDHGRILIEALLRLAEKGDLEAHEPEAPHAHTQHHDHGHHHRGGDGFRLADPHKLRHVARILEIEPEGKSLAELAGLVGEKLSGEFGRQRGEMVFPHRAPKPRIAIWRRLGLMPRGVDREVVDSLHRTNMGVDNDYRSLIMGALRTAIADGWGGSMIATELTDILLGTPHPIRSRVNLGVLKEDCINIVAHGHEPLLTESMVRATRDPELLAKARAAGARGINLAGMCCTSNEVLMRYGVPVAGNFLQQELAVLTGAVEAMVVDVQCIMSSLPDIAECFHTEVISTSPLAHFAKAKHVELDMTDPRAAAREIVERAIVRYPLRDPAKVHIPDEAVDLVAGFSYESLFHIMGGRYRSSYRPLNDGIITGRLCGVAGVVGCNNLKVEADSFHNALVKELISRDVMVVQTGCSAIACGKSGFLKPEAALEHAGPGLREICEATGLPPVLMAGSCVDNSRILMALTEMVREGGIGEDISELPVAGAAPEWVSEKALAIGYYFVASGVFTVFGGGQPIGGSEALVDFVTDELEGLLGGRFAFSDDPREMAALMIEHIMKKRKALGLRDLMYAKAHEPVEVPSLEERLPVG